MSTREDVHREFGAAAEIAQAMEHDLGRVLLAYKGLEEYGYLFDDPWRPEEAFVESIRRNTLGRLLKEIRRRFNLVGQFDPLDEAIAARNFLTHRFFLHHLNKMETEDGCGDMCEHLYELQRQLWAGHQIARGMADYLVAKYEESWGEHHAT